MCRVKAGFLFRRQEQVHFKWTCISVLWVMGVWESTGRSPYRPDSMHSTLKICLSPPTYTLTRTHTLCCCVTISHSFYISLFSLFSFQEQGAGSHLLIGFAEETYSLASFSSIPQGSLPLRWFPCLLLLPTQLNVHQGLLFFCTV